VTARWVAPLLGDPRVASAGDALSRGRIAELSGLTGPARLLLPLLVTQAPLLVVTAHERAVEEMADDLRTLAAEMGRSGSVLAFPAPGPAPLRGLPRHPEASLRRAAALHAAARGRLAAMVASPAGLLRPALVRRLLETRVVALRAGDEMTPEILLEALDEGGYRREDPVTAAGEVARRGGILDVFPPDRDAPVRVEFYGDTVYALRSFDPETQRTTGEVEGLELQPLSDLFAPRSVAAELARILPERFAGHRGVAPLLERLERGLATEEDLDALAAADPVGGSQNRVTVRHEVARVE